MLCPDDASLTAQAVTDCFYTRQVRTRTVEVVLADGSVAARQERYTVTVPLPPEEAYAALKGLLGRDITEEEKSNAEGVYALAAAQRR